MTKNPWAPDPDKVAERLEQVRKALETARKTGAPDHVLDNYRDEIEHCERLLAEPQEEPSAMDPLTVRTLIHYFSQRTDSASGGSPKGARTASLQEITGLPLLVSSLPAGLPREEEEQLEASIWTELFEHWCEILVARWKLHESGERAAARRVASAWSCPLDEAKARLVRSGLLDAMACARDDWSGRVGSGQGSSKVEAVPAHAGPIGGLKWLAQMALSCARERLRDTDPVVRHSDSEVELPRDPDSGQPFELRSPEWRRKGDQFDLVPVDQSSRGSSPLDPILAEEAAREKLDSVYAVAVGKESEKLDALRYHLHQGKDFTEARSLAARDLGVKENAIDLTISRLRKRWAGDSR